MAYAIARIAKLKGGSVAGAGKHVARARETPNADPDRQHENRLLIGDDRPLREVVTERIDQHGGKPRSDSVECVEVLLSASPEHFTEGREEINPERVRVFTDKAVEFLQEEYGANCVKATLHMDEKTPHVQAFVVPIDERGKLNCKRFFGTRAKLRQFQDAFAAKMEPLGLERGVEGSRATHTDVQRFYGMINQRVRLRVEPARVPDPPRVLVTEASRKEYKQQVIAAVIEQLREPVNVLSKQAQLAREEKGKREAAEQRAARAEERQRVAEAERLAELRESNRLAQIQHKLTATVLDERHQNSELKGRVEGLGREVQRLARRFADVPLVEVMHKLGYAGEQRDQATLYRDAQRQVALTIRANEAVHGEQVVARNSIDLVLHVGNVHQGREVTDRAAVVWLADTFGKERAIAATVAHAEQHAGALIHAHERSRELARTPQREWQRAQEPTHAQQPEFTFDR